METKAFKKLGITEQALKLFICPACGGKLSLDLDFINCIDCAKKYLINNGIPALITSLDKREQDQLFYYDCVYLSKKLVSQYNQYVEKMFLRVINENYFLPFLLPKINPDTVVLDVGCGGGNLGRKIANTDANIINMDISQKAVEHTASIIDSLKSIFIQGSLLSIPLDNASVDIVTAYVVLHHIEDTDRAISEIRRVLKPGGYFICLEPMERMTWFELWLDFFALPLFFKCSLKGIYIRLQRRFAFKDGRLDIDNSSNNVPQKHFFKSIDDYEQILKKYNFADVRLKSIFLEFLPPRFFELKHYNLVAMLFKISDVLIKNFKSLSKKGKFIIIEARNP